MRSPPQVVTHVAQNGFVGKGIAQLLEYGPQLIGGEEIEQHQDICLFGDFMSIWGVLFGLENAVEPLDIAVFLSIAFPIELFEILIALELADDPITMDNEVHPARHVVPPRQLFVPQVKRAAEMLTAVWGEKVENLQAGLQCPHRHDIGVSIIVQPRSINAW
jgi:hypothetical protein